MSFIKVIESINADQRIHLPSSCCRLALRASCRTARAPTHTWLSSPASIGRRFLSHPFSNIKAKQQSHCENRLPSQVEESVARERHRLWPDLVYESLNFDAPALIGNRFQNHQRIVRRVVSHRSEKLSRECPTEQVNQRIPEVNVIDGVGQRAVELESERLSTSSEKLKS